MRILSGLKPTGRPHLGNYFGALRQWIELQEKGEGYYFIADLHALDQVRNADELRAQIVGVALDYLALGLNPDKATVFMQSQIPEVTELTWILGSVTPMGLLNRAHAYKDAIAKNKETDFGLFAYPLLMSADILLYDTDVVPVGQDQKQHIEITRDIAGKLNAVYSPKYDPATGEGGALKLPDAYIIEETGVVPGTDGQKMSKRYGNTVEVFGSDKDVKKAIMRTVTDSTSVEAPKDPGTCNIFAMLKLFADSDTQAEIADRYRTGGTGYGDFKKLLLENFHEHFDAARARRKELEADLDYVHSVLARGAEQAREVASVVLGRVKRACGLL